MQLIDDATLLAMLQAVGAEPVDFGSASSVTAVVDMDYQEAAPGDAVMDSSIVRVTCRTIDVPGIGVDSRLVIGGHPDRPVPKGYRVLSNQPDGQGESTFICELA